MCCWCVQADFKHEVGEKWEESSSTWVFIIIMFAVECEYKQMRRCKENIQELLIFHIPFFMAYSPPPKRIWKQFSFFFFLENWRISQEMEIVVVNVDFWDNCLWMWKIMMEGKMESFWITSYSFHLRKYTEDIRNLRYSLD